MFPAPITILTIPFLYSFALLFGPMLFPVLPVPAVFLGCSYHGKSEKADAFPLDFPQPSSLAVFCCSGMFCQFISFIITILFCHANEAVMVLFLHKAVSAQVIGIPLPCAVTVIGGFLLISSLFPFTLFSPA